MLPDVQKRFDLRGIPLKKVGIRNFRLPLKVEYDKSQWQDTQATFSCYVALAGCKKGADLSRFGEVLTSLAQRSSFNVAAFSNLLLTMSQRLGGLCAVKAKFPIHLLKEAPATQTKAWTHYACRIRGNSQEPHNIALGVTVPSNTLCPCSLELTEGNVAHNQRANITVDVTCDLKRSFYWAELIRLVERSAQEIHNVLKRPDEKVVVESMYAKPCFVEDVVRDVVCALRQEERINDFSVVVEAFESIHQHSAVAVFDSGSEEVRRL